MRKGLLLLLCVAVAGSAFAQTRNDSPGAVGLDVLIPDTVAFPQTIDNAANWEAYVDVMGDGSLLMVVNTPDAFNSEGTERPGVVVVSPDLSVAEYAGYYADDGTPWLENVDTIRADGNPPQIGGDRRPGMARYIVGNESTPYDFGEFRSDDRWTSSYNDHMYCVQAFEVTANGAVPLFNVIDPFYGSAANGGVGKGRTGGVAGLDNGNWVCSFEDRNNFISGFDKAPVVTIIDGDTGATVVAPFSPSEFSTDGWDGLTSHQGGFSYRVNGTVQINFYDNDANLNGTWFQDTLPDDAAGQAFPFDPADNPGAFSTSIASTRRGDGVHTVSPISSTDLYYVGMGFDLLQFGEQGAVFLIKIDGTTQQTVKEVLVTENSLLGGPYDNFSEPDRVSCYADENGNVAVAWSDRANTGNRQVLARVFNSDLEPVTESFLVFQSSSLDGSAGVPDSETYHPQVAMNNNGILVTARTGGVEVNGEAQPLNAHLFTVLENPLAVQAVDTWELF